MRAIPVKDGNSKIPDPQVSASKVEIARQTFRWDIIRSCLSGLMDSGWRIFALLVVTRYFDGTSFAKALVPAAFTIGLLSTPIALFYLPRLRLQTSKLCSINYMISGILFWVASLGVDSLWLFLGAGTAAAAVLAQQMPLLIHIYSTNYASGLRGKRVAYAISVSITIAPVFGWFGGQLLEEDLSQFPILFQIMAAACIFSGICIYKVPSEILQRSPSGNPLTHLSLAWKDKVFGCMLGMWMILGFGNLSTMPLQIEYMTSDEYSIHATNTQIAIAGIIIPSTVRIFATSIWGHLFDAFNFFLVRAFTSAIQLAAILIFFFSDTMAGIYIGSLGYGLAMAGGNVNWSLWVTKFAPPGQESDYMTVHSFMTGVRGLVAPFIGFYMLNLISIQSWATIGSLLVALSIVLLFPISRLARR